jgi:hypothetical protein
MASRACELTAALFLDKRQVTPSRFHDRYLSGRNVLFQISFSVSAKAMAGPDATNYKYEPITLRLTVPSVLALAKLSETNQTNSLASV